MPAEIRWYHPSQGQPPTNIRQLPSPQVKALSKRYRGRGWLRTPSQHGYGCLRDPGLASTFFSCCCDVRNLRKEGLKPSTMVQRYVAGSLHHQREAEREARAQIIFSSLISLRPSAPDVCAHVQGGTSLLSKMHLGRTSQLRSLPGDSRACQTDNQH